jgi:hypothetical protein
MYRIQKKRYNNEIFGAGLSPVWNSLVVTKNLLNIINWMAKQGV